MSFLKRFTERGRVTRAPGRKGSLRLSIWGVALLALALIGPVQAQPSSGAADQLSEALKTLARDGRNLPALIAAGSACLDLGDIDGATGFLNRAAAVAPEDGRVKAGLARLAAQRGDALRALQLFEEAERAGIALNLYAADRGLAYDLVGNNGRAQQLYREALASGAGDVVTMRLALSQAIAGDQAAADQTLLPLLKKQDLGAFRTRAFALAAVGKTEEAVSIAETLLPAELASRMAPYLRYMPYLTRAQMAAAASLGAFPPASEVGRDDPRFAAHAGQQPTPAVGVRPVDARLTPSGAPLGPKPNGAQGPALASAPPASTPLPSPARGAAFLTPTPPPSSQPPPAIGLAQAFADVTFRQPGNTAPASGAVDITTIQPPRERAKPPAPKPVAAPVHPSRHWVQVATGSDTRALGFDWRRISRQSGGLLDRKGPFIADWGTTHRLLSGPYESVSAAQGAVNALKAKGLSTFTFTSAEGEAVRPLG